MFYIRYDIHIDFNYNDLVPGSTKEEWLDSQNLNSPFRPLFDEARQKVKNITLEQVEDILKSIGYDEVKIEEDSFIAQSGKVEKGQTRYFDSCMIYFAYENHYNNEEINKVKLKRHLVKKLIYG